METKTIVDALERNGHFLVEGFLTGEELEATRRAMAQEFPMPGAPSVTLEHIQAARHAVPFPFSNNALSRVPFDPRILNIAEGLLGTSDLRLTSSFIQAKYGTRYVESNDQALHNDAWAASSLLFPRDDGVYQRLFGILYLTDVDLDAAPTYVVARARELGVPLLAGDGKASYSRDEYPELYEQEKPITAPAGSLLLFVGDIVHRGSAFRHSDGTRMALFFNIHAAQASWTDKHVWSLRPSIPKWQVFSELIVELTVRQRELLGFPVLGDPYWNNEAITGLEALYEGIDTSPYRTAGTEEP